MSKIPTIKTEDVDDAQPSRREATSTPTAQIENSDQETMHRKMSLLGWTEMTPQEVAIWIDYRSRIVFPVAFIIFNICYWSLAYLY